MEPKGTSFFISFLRGLFVDVEEENKRKQERLIATEKALRETEVFNFWFKEFLTDLLFDLEMYDIKQEEIREKYEKELYSLEEIGTLKKEETGTVKKRRKILDWMGDIVRFLIGKK